MTNKQTITNRVKFIIRYLISKGIAKNQEELGRKIAIDSKSYLSQLVGGKQNNTVFINKLMSLAPEINKEWLYNESIESPFISAPQEENLKKNENPDEKIKELEINIISLQKDVKYYADMADSRLQTINIQNKLINEYEKQLKK